MRAAPALVALIGVCAPAVAAVVEIDVATQQRAGIVTESVVAGSFADELRVVGEVVRTPGSTLTVKSVIPGRVEKVLATPGESVAAGDVLLTLHSHDLLTMQARLLVAAEQSRLSATRLEAGRELYAVEGISRLELQAREQEAFAADLERDAAFEELVDHGLPRQVVDEVLDTRTTNPHLPIVAPVDGVVLELRVQVHEWVEAYSPLMIVGDPQKVEVEIQLPPDQASSVAVGDTIELAPVGRPVAAASAKVITRVPQVDPATRTLRLRAALVDGHDGLFPGVFVEGTLRHGKLHQGPSVPESAVINVDGSDVVFVRLDSVRLEARVVSLGPLDGGRYEVLSGVSEGEQVAVGGVFFLKSALVSGGGEEP